MVTMQSVPLGDPVGSVEIASFSGSTDRPLVVVGNGPSAAMPDLSRLPADPVVFRVNWFFLESLYHFGSHADAWFSSVSTPNLERSLADEIRSRRYTVDRFATPMRLLSTRVGESQSYSFLFDSVVELDSWAPIANHPRMARHFMSRPGLPTTGLQALAFGLAVGFRDVYLVGIDMYESSSMRYAFTVPHRVATTLREKDLQPGYEQAHGLDTDLAFLRACIAEFPDAHIWNLTASENLTTYLERPPQLPAEARMAAPLQGQSKARLVVTLSSETGAPGVAVAEPPAGRLWAEVDGKKCAYVTFVAGAYHHGARALANSLRRHTSVPLIALATPDADQGALLASGIPVIEVPPIRNPRTSGIEAQARFDATYTKLHVFRLDFLDRVVYLDSDTIVLQDIDDLFRRESFAAAPDSGIEVADGRIFNSGVFVTTPDRTLFDRMMAAVRELPSYDGGDQGFLNRFFTSWDKLPPEYNTTKRIAHAHPELHHPRDVKVLHYVGTKPWEPSEAEGPYERLDYEWLQFLEEPELRELVRDLRAYQAPLFGGQGTVDGEQVLRRARAAGRARNWTAVEQVLRSAWATRKPTTAERREGARALRHLGRHREALAMLVRAARAEPRARRVWFEMAAVGVDWLGSQSAKGTPQSARRRTVQAPRSPHRRDPGAGTGTKTFEASRRGGLAPEADTPA